MSRNDDMATGGRGFHPGPAGVHCETHVDRFSYFLESGIESDITLLSGLEKRPVKAHKLILMIASPVLRHMLKTNGDAKTFDMPGLHYEELMIFLRFIYTGRLPESMESAMCLLQAAEVYEIPDLATHCEKLLALSLTNDCVLQIYQQSIKYQNVFLEKSAMAYICKNASKIIESKQFQELSSETLLKIMEKDSLEVINEIQLFDATLRWAHAECERQNVVISTKYVRSLLESVIHLIRFPQMSPSDFSLKVATAQVLTTEEIVSVLLYFNVPQSQRHCISPGLFNSNPRKYYVPHGTIYILKRLHPIRAEDNWSSTPTPGIPTTTVTHCIQFRVDTPMWIQSVGVNPTLQRQSDTADEFVQLKVKIADSVIEKVIAQKTVTFLLTNLVTTLHHIQLDSPVRTKKDTWYTTSFKIVSGNYVGSLYTASGNGNMVAHTCDDGKKVFFEFQDVESSSTLTNTLKGYLPEFGFQLD